YRDRIVARALRADEEWIGRRRVLGEDRRGVLQRERPLQEGPQPGARVEVRMQSPGCGQGEAIVIDVRRRADRAADGTRHADRLAGPERAVVRGRPERQAHLVEGVRRADEDPEL